MLTRAERDRLRYVTQQLEALKPPPVKFICIGCGRNEQVNRKLRRCGPCIANNKTGRANGKRSAK